MNLPVVPLLAANLDWLEGLFGALVVLFWIGSQIWGVLRRAAAPREPVVVRRPAPPAPPAGADDPRTEIARQIEEFLRDATGSGQSPPGQRRPPASPAAPPRPARPRKTPAAARPQPTAPAAAPPRLPEAGRPMGGLGGHSGDIARHVREAFAPRSGAGAVPAARPTPPLTAELAALLRSPETLRQLFLAREILDRPEQRW